MKLYKFLLCACLALPVMSCDDYLDIQPKGIVIPEKSEDYERLLNYAQLLRQLYTILHNKIRVQPLLLLLWLQIY